MDTIDTTAPTESEPAAASGDAESPNVHVTTPDGHHVELTTRMSGRDMMVLVQLEGFDPKRLAPGAVGHLFPQLMAMLERHVVEHDYDDPDILAQDPLVLIRDVMKPWQEARREQAVPKGSASRSQRRSHRRR